MTHFTDADIGDLAEEVIAVLDGMRTALRSRDPRLIAASKERERKLERIAVGVLEALGRRPPRVPPPPQSVQLSFVPDGPTGLPD